MKQLGIEQPFFDRLRDGSLKAITTNLISEYRIGDVIQLSVSEKLYTGLPPFEIEVTDILHSDGKNGLIPGWCILSVKPYTLPF